MWHAQSHPMNEKESLSEKPPAIPQLFWHPFLLHASHLDFASFVHFCSAFRIRRSRFRANLSRIASLGVSPVAFIIVVVGTAAVACERCRASVLSFVFGDLACLFAFERIWVEGHRSSCAGNEHIHCSQDSMPRNDPPSSRVLVVCLRTKRPPRHRCVRCRQFSRDFVQPLRSRCKDGGQNRDLLFH